MHADTTNAVVKPILRDFESVRPNMLSIVRTEEGVEG
jgi:hypothetical protein